MHRMIILSISLSAVIAFGHCTKSKQSQKISLLVSATHRKIFADLKNSSYAATEAVILLSKIAGKSDDFCRGLPSKTALLNAPEPSNSTWPKDQYKAALLGCRNWYTMSDIRPEDDFIKLNTYMNAKGDSEFDCYAVGLLQPYIMAANLNCIRLNMVDVDFRIIKAHLDFLNLLKGKSHSGIKTLLSNLRFSFPAGGPQQKRTTKTGIALADLCGKNDESKCLHYLINFATKFSAIKEINLILSPLHEFQFLPNKHHLASAFYSSNAFDPHFTSREQFEQFRLRSGKISEPLKRFIIYHQAEENNFGIYQIDKSLQISTICADRYLNVVSGRYSENRCRYFPASATTYDTYFDKDSLNRQDKKLCATQH